MQPMEQWLEQAIVYLLPIGFFAEFENRPTAEVRRLIVQQPEFEFFWPYMESANTLADGEQILVIMDESRVWANYDHDAIGEDNDYFLKTLPAWNRISRGLTPLQNIDVDWDSLENDLISVSFSVDGKRYSFDYSGRDREPVIHQALAAINQLIAEKGYQFEFFNSAPLECGLVTLLDAQEKENLQRDRGWYFYDLTQELEKGFLRRQK